MGESILNFRYLSFHSFLKIQVSTWCIYFSSPFGTPFGVSFQQICTMTTCLRVLLSENAFYLHCWSIVLLGIEFWADKLFFFFSFEPFKNVVYSLVYFHNLWWESCGHSIRSFSVCKVLFSSGYFQYCPLIFGL